jgi:hypothetical protein
MASVLAAWDWAAISAVGVAVGTLALAVATFVLAKQTGQVVATNKELVGAAQGQTRAAQGALDAQTAPLLSSMPPGLDREPDTFDASTGEAKGWRDAGTVSVRKHDSGDDGSIFLSVPFRNVGNGVATIGEVQFVLSGGTAYVGHAASLAVSPGERTRAILQPTRSKSSWQEASVMLADKSSFAVTIGYADAAGRLRGAVRLDVHHRAERLKPWFVRQVHFGDSVDSVQSSPRSSSFLLD